MLFKRTLQRESDSSNRTITIEDGLSSCKYMVIVNTVKSQIPSPQSTSFGGPEIERYPFNEQYEAIQCAQQKLAEPAAQYAAGGEEKPRDRLCPGLEIRSLRRNTSHLLTAQEEFNHLGVRFISVQDQIDTESPMGRAMFTIK